MELFRLTGKILVDNSEAENSLNSVQNKFTDGLKTAGKWAAGAVAAAGAVGAGLMKVAKDASNSLSDIKDGAQQLGMSYESYQELNYALERSGASIDNVAKGMVNITNDLDDFANGSTKASEKYDRLGISLKNADGTMKSSDAVLKESLIALAGMSDETQRNAIANDIFGKSYQQLLPLLEEGSDGIQDLIDNSHALGLVMEDEAIDEGEKFGDMLDDLQDSFGTIMTKIGISLMPLIEEVVQYIIDHIPEIQAFLQNFFSVLGELITVVIDVIRAIAPVVDELWNNYVYPILGEIVTFLEGIFTGDIQKVFDGLFGFIKKLFGGLLDILKKPFDAFLNMLSSWWQKATEPFKKLADSISNIWQSIKSKFKLPHFTLSGSLNPLKWIDEGMPKIGVEWYAKGGIVNDPTMFGFNPYSGKAMMAGEAGPEAIAPLSKLEDYFKKWSSNEEEINCMDRIIEKIDNLASQMASMQLVLDTGVLAGEMSNRINKEFSKVAAKERRGM